MSRRAALSCVVVRRCCASTGQRRLGASVCALAGWPGARGQLEVVFGAVVDQLTAWATPTGRWPRRPRRPA
eukprot:4826681-Lingulodinium_polyedra.AAC.1